MNGNVVSDLPDFVLEKAKHGSYYAHIGTGGNSISANGINGNISFSRAATASTVTVGEHAKSQDLRSHTIKNRQAWRLLPGD